MLSGLATTSGKVGKRGISVNARIVKNTIVIAPCTNCHYQKISLIISMALLVGVGHEKTIEKEEELEERLETNDLCLYDVDKLILSLDRVFPLYDSVKHVITNITMKRYNMFKKLFDAMMYCRDKEEIKTWIQYTMKYNVNATAYDFNKIVRTLLNKPEFDLMD